MEASLNGSYYGDFFDSATDEDFDIARLHSYVEGRITTLEEFLAVDGKAVQVSERIEDTVARQLGMQGDTWPEPTLLAELTVKLQKGGVAGRFNPEMTRDLFYRLVSSWDTHIHIFLGDITENAVKFVKAAPAYAIRPHILPEVGDILTQRLVTSLQEELSHLFPQLRHGHKSKKAITFQNVNSFSAKAQKVETARMCLQKSSMQKGGQIRPQKDVFDTSSLLQALGEENLLWQTVASATVIGAEAQYQVSFFHNFKSWTNPRLHQYEVEKLMSTVNFAEVTQILSDQLSSVLDHRAIGSLTADEVSRMSADRALPKSDDRAVLDHEIKQLRSHIARSKALMPKGK